MRIKAKFIQTQGPIFVAGTNLPDKLKPQSVKGDMDLFYDTELQLGMVIYKGEVGLFPVAAWVPENSADVGVEFKSEQVTRKEPTVQVGRTQLAPNEVRTAQVSTPIDKVQQRKGKAPKYQGEESQ